MGEHGWSALIALLAEAPNGPEFTRGLSDAGVSRAEDNYGFRFPPDLREFLQTALPLGRGFPDWRLPDDPNIKTQLGLPLQGVLFDVEHNAFWLPEWGERPEQMEDAKKTVERLVRTAPQLIPIYKHRMMPNRPSLVGNPVLSVHQTDIIWYGFDLDDYLRHEFELPGRKAWPNETRPIQFWDVEHWQDLRW